MSIARLVVMTSVVMMLWAPIAVAREDGIVIDLATIPPTPTEMLEPGFLLEGGGYIVDPATLENLIASLDGGDPGGFTGDAWERSYMHRLVLLADSLDPGSDLLADEITLIHEFNTGESAEEARGSLAERFTDLGESTEAGTFRIVDESADSLVSVFASGPIVVQVTSTDLTGQPNADSHRAAVDLSRLRADAEIDDPVPGLSASVLRVDDSKLNSFADTADTYQHYQAESGVWTSTIGFPESYRAASEFNITEVFESQQVLVLNTGDQIVFQVWLAQFDSESAAAVFVADPQLSDMPTPMFADQADALPAETGFSIRGVLDDGNRYSGYRDLSHAGNRVVITGLIGSGDQLVNREQATAFAGSQLACLELSRCEAISTAGILDIESESTPDPASQDDGVFESALFAWSVDYGLAGWELNAIEAVEGIDYLDLVNERSLAAIETVVDRHGEPQQCVVEALRLLEEFEEGASITLGSDVEGEPNAGSEPDHAWAVYTVEPLADERADQEYTIRMDCYTLIEGEASLLVTHTAPRDMWDEESAKGADLRANIDIRDAAAAASDEADVQVRNVDVLIPRMWIPLAA